MVKEEHRSLGPTIQEIVGRVVAPLAQDIDEEDRFPREAFVAMGLANLLGLVVPPPYGSGPDYPCLVTVVETIAATSPSTAWAYVMHVSSSAGIALTGVEELRQRLLPALVKGEGLATFAFSEPAAGSDFSAIETTAARTNDGYLLHGTKSFISLAGEAEAYLVMAKTQREDGSSGLSVFVVERGSAGFSTGRHFRGMGMRGISWGELLINGCLVPQANLLSEEGRAGRVLGAMGHVYAIGAAALGMGIAQGALDLTVEHLKRRQIKGQALGSLESLQFRAAEIGARVEAVRSLVYRAATEDDPKSLLPFQAKLFASEAAIDVARECLQLHGATGFSQESPMQRLVRDAFALPLHFDNNDFLRRFLGRALIGV